MKKRLAIIALIAAGASLSGCAVFNGPAFDNIVSCAKAGDMALVNSMYGPVGVTSKIRDADARAICAKP